MAVNGNGAHTRQELPPLPPEQMDLVWNALSFRKDFLSQFSDPRRNVEDECGFPRLEQSIDAWACHELFLRDAFAARVVNILPKETWKVHPGIHEDESSDEITEFEVAWSELCQNLGADPSWHRDDAASVLFDYFQRLDTISGIGRYGVLLLGVDDGKPLHEPVKGFKEENSFGYYDPSLNSDKVKIPEELTSNSHVPSPAEMMSKPYRLTVNAPGYDTSAGRPLSLVYLRVFGETTAQITRFEANPTSPRHGMPVEYLLSMVDPRDTTGTGAVGLSASTMRVHWSRVIHVADLDGTSSQVFGIPRQQPVWNNLQSLRKIVHGSGEMYWKGAFPGLSIETHPSLGADVSIDVESARGALENYMNGLQRYLALPGVTAKSLAPQIADPKAFKDAQIEALCIFLGCPVRTFLGSDNGMAAGDQAGKDWEGRVIARRQGHATCRILVPFVDRMILMGVLPEPEDGYMAIWPDSTSPTEDDKANVATKWTNAMSIYVSSGLDAIIAPLDFLVVYMGFDIDEATTLLENSLEWQETNEEPLASFGAKAGASVDNPVATDSEGNPAKPGQTLDQAQGGQS